MPESTTVKCSQCPAELGAQLGTRIKHHADGSHTVIPPTPPRASVDPKPRGRRYA